ncbi:hypothetical protein WALSEDRAFT_59728 [Wallemia mellicola CBS 633.66]|uniref:Uncharacterized protein n=1 Tax=Wallemia mellicola (strain ATCC MYA-4683 / CBS 633.66) TaxID=671144 RepID=I4YGC5_WALMC|nr:hypothetical protein WALSEDRAFT_59728 [Wallemia mellicola CBS 633.66]EIM23017.1 hypothetical protein WALSEDRAFT_59728 [Wallemia mellicola CBS 633.66]|eukprot:XP_006957056.1 hypothetical protein WALSEDRAFT_59728 [Wallemia mellicola CBS 633.66]
MLYTSIIRITEEVTISHRMMFTCHMWRDEQEIAYNNLDKNEADLNQAANDFGYKWEYDHPDNDKACFAFGANLFERLNNGRIVGGNLAVHPQPGQLQVYEDECDQHLNNPSEDMGLLPIH